MDTCETQTPFPLSLRKKQLTKKEKSIKDNGNTKMAINCIFEIPVKHKTES